MTPDLFIPDLIIVAARIHRFDRPVPASAVAVGRGRILAVGASRKILPLRRRGTRVLRLPHATLTPGLVDCHTHFFSWAVQRHLVIDLSRSSQSLDSVLQKIRKHVRSPSVGGWVLARGFDANGWVGGLPTARDLDRAVPDRPALVRSRDGHMAWLNSAAMARCGIHAGTPDPPVAAGGFRRDTAGRPTGLVHEAAIDTLPDPLRDHVAGANSGVLRAVDHALRTAYAEAWRLGITGVHCMDDAVSLSHFQRQATAGQLGLRVVHAVPLANAENAYQAGLRSGLGNSWLRLGGIKIFADGSLGSQTAWMFDTYPGRDEYTGVPIWAPEELLAAVRRAAVRRAAQHGWAVWIHAIGDRAVHEAVRAIAAAHTGRSSVPTRTAMPHRIEHAQCARPMDIRRMGRRGIVASVQPCHLLGDLLLADQHWPRARSNAYPLKQLLEAGVIVVAGSDVPVESLDPRRSLFAATMRTMADGSPAGGWFPGQRLSTEEVLRAFTLQAARSIGQPPPAGAIAPGGLADFTVWAEDPLAVPASRLLNVGIRGCVVGGVVHLDSDS